jgi:predicted transcriptional regulator
MSVEEVKSIYNYFQTKIGRAKVGQFVSEMRRQISIKLSKDGASPTHIAKIINSDRATVYHYLKYCSPPSKYVETSVEEGMMQWISEGLIPKRITLKNESTFVLVDDVNTRARAQRATKKTKHYDNLLEELEKELDIKI